MNKKLEMNHNKLVAFIGKHYDEFTKASNLHSIHENGIRKDKYMNPDGEGRLQTNNFVIIQHG